MSFKFELGQEVNIVTRGINAKIVGRAEYLSADFLPNYCFY